jgi:flavin reductase (DIM6/NTAB) family NADH-FMN oxidoreductase RutF
LQENADEDEDSEAPVAVIVTMKGCGKPVNEILELFTDAIAAQQLTSGNKCVCKHCKENVRHHNKTNSVQRHLENCRQFGVLMKNTAVADCPEWFDCKVLTSQSISDVGCLRKAHFNHQ